MGQYLLLLFVLMALALPFWRYRRTRLAGESLGGWMGRTEQRLLSPLGHDLRAAPWLTPRLFLRSLWGMGRTAYGVFWLGALLVLLGDAVNLSWSWQRADPWEMAGGLLEALLAFTLFFFLLLFCTGHAQWPGYIDYRRLAWHWLWLWGYAGLAVQVLPWFVDEPGIYIFRAMVVPGLLPAPLAAGGPAP